MLGLLGKKIGMTQIFDEKGDLIPVTVIKVDDNVVMGVRVAEKHGYNALVLGAFPLIKSVKDKGKTVEKQKKVKKPYSGQFPKKMVPHKLIREFRDFGKEYKIGDAIGVELFEEIKYVDITALTKGKGFQGVMRRHGFRGGRKSHGSKFHRAGGSTGQAASPSKVLKGTRMAGRMGGNNKTVQNLRVVKVDKEKKVLLVKGGIPGASNNTVMIAKALKR